MAITGHPPATSYSLRRMASTSKPAVRMSAADRREAVLAAAMEEFAVSGLHGASGEAIATRAGISQPYLFRLFGTKRELFLAVVDLAFERVRVALAEAAESSAPERILPAMSDALDSVLADGQGFLLMLQLYAACGDDEVRFAVRRHFAGCYRYVERASGADPDDVRDLFAHTTLRAVGAAMRLSELPAREAWARRLLGDTR
jgi:AcrR family transcriptional regulator